MGLKCLPSRCYGGWDAAYDRDSVHEFLPVCNIVRANRVTSSTVCSSRVAASSSSASSVQIPDKCIKPEEVKTTQKYNQQNQPRITEAN